MLDEFKKQLMTNSTPVADILAKALPIMRGKVSDDKLTWLASELQGYSNTLAFYQTNRQGFPDYRVVNGRLRLVNPSGQLSEVAHPLANRTHYFLGAPLAWLEASAAVPGGKTIVEMPELTKYIGAIGGNIVCECSPSQLSSIIDAFKRKFIVILDELSATAPK